MWGADGFRQVHRLSANTFVRSPQASGHVRDGPRSGPRRRRPPPAHHFMQPTPKSPVWKPQLMYASRSTHHGGFVATSMREAPTPRVLSPPQLSVHDARKMSKSPEQRMGRYALYRWSPVPSFQQTQRILVPPPVPRSARIPSRLRASSASPKRARRRKSPKQRPPGTRAGAAHCSGGRRVQRKLHVRSRSRADLLPAVEVRQKRQSNHGRTGSVVEVTLSGNEDVLIAGSPSNQLRTAAIPSWQGKPESTNDDVSTIVGRRAALSTTATSPALAPPPPEQKLPKAVPLEVKPDLEMKERTGDNKKTALQTDSATRQTSGTSTSRSKDPHEVVESNRTGKKVGNEIISSPTPPTSRPAFVRGRGHSRRVVGKVKRVPIAEENIVATKSRVTGEPTSQVFTPSTAISERKAVNERVAARKEVDNVNNEDDAENTKPDSCGSLKDKDMPNDRLPTDNPCKAVCAEAKGGTATTAKVNQSKSTGSSERIRRAQRRRVVDPIDSASESSLSERKMRAQRRRRKPIAKRNDKNLTSNARMHKRDAQSHTASKSEGAEPAPETSTTERKSRLVATRSGAGGKKNHRNPAGDMDTRDAQPREASKTEGARPAPVTSNSERKSRLAAKKSRPVGNKNHRNTDGDISGNKREAQPHASNKAEAAKPAPGTTSSTERRSRLAAKRSRPVGKKNHRNTDGDISGNKREAQPHASNNAEGSDSAQKTSLAVRKQGVSAHKEKQYSDGKPKPPMVSLMENPTESTSEKNNVERKRRKVVRSLTASGENNSTPASKLAKKLRASNAECRQAVSRTRGCTDNPHRSSNRKLSSTIESNKKSRGIVRMVDLNSYRHDPNLQRSMVYAANAVCREWYKLKLRRVLKVKAALESGQELNKGRAVQSVINIS